MDILPPELSGGKAGATEINAEPAVRRGIEVTVERETITMLVRSQPQQGTAAQNDGKSQTGPIDPELPPPSPATPRDKDGRQQS